MKQFLRAFALLASMTVMGTLSAAEKIPVLVIDGQNNHNWKVTTPILNDFLTKSGRFEVTVATTPPAKSPEAAWDEFDPDFSHFKVVLSNYNGELWPQRVQKKLVEFVQTGGGLVIVHAANNAFPEWAEWNKMIGLGWRGNTFGDRVTLDDEGQEVRTAKGEGPGAGHGQQHEFAIRIRDNEHPVTAGMPAEWKHVKDELYHGQRGPAQAMHVLATAYSDPGTGGTGAHEPMIWWIPYGEGKVFTTVLGHADYSMKGVGFQTTVLRGCEWAATGEVTIPIPENFPTAEKATSVE